MARSLRGSSRLSRPSSRRQTEWALGPGNATPTAVSTTVATILGSVIVPTASGLTIVRLRGIFQMYLTLATAVNDGFLGAFGIGVATAAATAAGGGSVPTPITEEDSDNWLFHHYISCVSGKAFAADTDPGGQIISATTEFEVDSKAMRKFPNEMAIYASLEVTEVGTATAQVFFDSRMLVKLS